MTEAKQEANQLGKLRQEPLSLRNELHYKHFGLHHHAPEDFHRSQWQSKQTSCGFLIYRWCLAAFFGSGWVSFLSVNYNKGHWFIYLTNWGFTLCAITSGCGATFVSIYHRSPEKMMKRRCLMKFYWACYWINLVLTHMTSTIYWTCIYPKDKMFDNPLRLTMIFNIWIHVIPPVIFTIDHLVVAHPARLLHFIYPCMFALGYAGFAFVYYLLGGLDPLGRVFIYPMLDYTKPLRVLTTVGMITALLVFLSALQYGVYRLRVFIARKLNKLM